MIMILYARDIWRKTKKKTLEKLRALLHSRFGVSNEIRTIKYYSNVRLNRIFVCPCAADRYVVLLQMLCRIILEF